MSIPRRPARPGPAGARRPLGSEPLISTADLARFLEETPPPLAQARAGQQVAIARLRSNWTDEALDAMRARKASAVQVQSAKVAALQEVQAELKVNPTAGVIPEKVQRPPRSQPPPFILMAEGGGGGRCWNSLKRTGANGNS